MASLTFKSRPKMHSWTPPEPPKPKRSRFYLWAILGWLAVTAVGYRWAAIDVASRAESSDGSADDDRDFDAAAVAQPKAPPGPRTNSEAERNEPNAPSANEAQARGAETERDPAAPRRAKDGDPIVGCEDFLEQARARSDSRLPAYLGRSVLDPFISDNDWARPCRGKHRRTVKLCVAVRDGSVVGLSARTSPPNLAFENCLREQAAKLALQPDSTLRVIQTTLSL